MEKDRITKGPEFDQIIGYISEYSDRRSKLIAEGLNSDDRNWELFEEIYSGRSTGIFRIR